MWYTASCSTRCQAHQGCYHDRLLHSQVHAAILEDLVYPTEVVGKRLRFRLDGSKLHKVGERWVSVPLDGLVLCGGVRWSRASVVCMFGLPLSYLHGLRWC